MMMTPVLYRALPLLLLEGSLLRDREREVQLDMYLGRCQWMLAMFPVTNTPPRADQLQVLTNQSAMVYKNWIMLKQRKKRLTHFLTYKRTNGESSSKRWRSKFYWPITRVQILMHCNSATPVPFGRGKGKPVNVPDHPPPPGYLCYRCREKGKFCFGHKLTGC